MNKGKRNYNNGSLLISVCVGTGTSIIISLIVALLGSLCISNEYIECNASGSIVIIGQFVGILLGVLIASGISSENKMLACWLVCGAYYLLMLGAGMLFFNGVGEAAMWGLLSCITGCVAGIVVCFKCKTRFGVKKRRRSR